MEKNKKFGGSGDDGTITFMERHYSRSEATVIQSLYFSSRSFSRQTLNIFLSTKAKMEIT